jgi:hypothetical protein
MSIHRLVEDVIQSTLSATELKMGKTNAVELARSAYYEILCDPDTKMIVFLRSLQIMSCVDQAQTHPTDENLWELLSMVGALNDYKSTGTMPADLILRHEIEPIKKAMNAENDLASAQDKLPAAWKFHEVRHKFGRRNKSTRTSQLSNPYELWLQDHHGTDVIVNMIVPPGVCDWI